MKNCLCVDTKLQGSMDDTIPKRYVLRLKRWELPGFQGKQVLFNARSESALEKKSFREGTEHRRIVIPAAWFYEWNRNKEKNIFYRKGESVLFVV